MLLINSSKKVADIHGLNQNNLSEYKTIIISEYRII